MNGIKIDYEEEQEGQLPKKIIDYECGYYLVKERLRTQKFEVISISSDVIHFHRDGNYCPGYKLLYSNTTNRTIRGCWLGVVGGRQGKYIEFFDMYHMIGKIKSMRITDIKLE